MSRYRPLCHPRDRNLKEGHGSDNASPDKEVCGDCHEYFEPEKMFDKDTCWNCQGRRTEHASHFPWA